MIYLFANLTTIYTFKTGTQIDLLLRFFKYFFLSPQRFQPFFCTFFSSFSFFSFFSCCKHLSRHTRTRIRPISTADTSLDIYIQHVLVINKQQDACPHHQSVKPTTSCTQRKKTHHKVTNLYHYYFQHHQMFIHYNHQVPPHLPISLLTAAHQLPIAIA